MGREVRRWFAACGVAAAVASAPIAAASRRQAPAAGQAAAFDVRERTIGELQAALASGAVSSRGLVLAYLARIRAYDLQGPQINAMIAMNPKVLEIADALDRERAAGRVRGPLHGIPIVIKDNFETVEMPTTGGSLALTGFMTGRDAFQVKRLRDAGAVIIGKTNLHELAAGITTISSLGGQTRNPYELTRNPGGSSGGTGAAVASSFAAAGMGSDTCGSIRIPSANNNLVGLRGTMGLSSRNGIIPLSHTQDIGGPLARTVTDLAMMLDATVGADPEDPMTQAGAGHIPPSYVDLLKGDALQHATIGVVKNLFGTAPEEEEVGAIDRKALEAMHKAGATLVEVSIPGIDELMRGSSLIDAEFKFDLMAYLARWPNAPVHSLAEILDRGDYSFALETIFRRRNARTSPDTPDVAQARAKRSELLESVTGMMTAQHLDAVAYPPLRRKAAAIGEPQRGGENCQLSASTGLPAISVPAGFTEDGVPVGLELLGPAWSEATLLSIAFSYEQATHPRQAPASTPSMIGGRAPSTLTFIVNLSGAHVTFSFDPVVGTLAWDAASTTPLVASVHRGRQGPALATLMTNKASEAAGIVRLVPADRDALRSGGLFLAVRTMATPEQVERAPLRVIAP
ncbi:MAG TPA: amidase family protein [Vicinamibacterales bacterium]|nr:amidase family protein [Vicinamibacterales bacterium]